MGLNPGPCASYTNFVSLSYSLDSLFIFYCETWFYQVAQAGLEHPVYLRLALDAPCNLPWETTRGIWLLGTSGSRPLFLVVLEEAGKSSTVDWVGF